MKIVGPINWTMCKPSITDLLISWGAHFEGGVGDNDWRNLDFVGYFYF